MNPAAAKITSVTGKIPRITSLGNSKPQKPGVYRVEIVYSCQAGAEGSEFTVELGNQSLAGKSKSTGDWSKFTTEKLGTLKIGKDGIYTLTVKPKAEPKWKVIGLQAVILTPVER